jgi:hypothetical protein
MISLLITPSLNISSFSSVAELVEHISYCEEGKGETGWNQRKKESRIL